MAVLTTVERPTQRSSKLPLLHLLNANRLRAGNKLGAVLANCLRGAR
jgi:hypothetical protein